MLHYGPRHPGPGSAKAANLFRSRCSFTANKGMPRVCHSIDVQHSTAHLSVFSTTKNAKRRSKCTKQHMSNIHIIAFECCSCRMRCLNMFESLGHQHYQNTCLKDQEYLFSQRQAGVWLSGRCPVWDQRSKSSFPQPAGTWRQKGPDLLCSGWSGHEVWHTEQDTFSDTFSDS